MKIRLTLVAMAITAFICSTAQETSTTIIPVEIIYPDTFHFEFGYFGDEEGIVLEQAPLYASYYELGGDQWGLRTFYYQAQDPFTPSDTAMLIEFRGSDGAGPSQFIDTTIFVFNPIIDGLWEKNELKPLIGPNPCSGSLLYTSSFQQAYVLYDTSGSSVLQGLTTVSGELSLGNLKTGLYYLVINGHTEKIIRL
jgi:hypothetical protein